MGTSITSPCPLNSVGVVFSNGALSVCEEPGLFGGSYRTPLVSNPFRCNSSLELEVSFGIKVSSWGFVSPVI